MTTNQTIDGVPLLPCPFCGGEPYGTHDHYVHDDLSPMPCVECRACSAHLKAEDWNRRAEPAAQPQGEPVAWANWKVGSRSYVPYRTAGEARRCVEASEISATQNGPYRVVPLYAEQTAPVAVTYQQVLTAYEYAESHPHKYLRGTTNWCAAVAHSINSK